MDWLRLNASEIRSSDIADDDFSDLQYLKEAIGDRRIVMLGEGDHGEGSVFVLKGRLVRFLHEEMGFNVLAWESSLTCCRNVNEAFATGKGELHERIDQGLFGVWGKTEETQDLFHYIADSHKTGHPLIQAGFDCQYSSLVCGENFLVDVTRFFNSGTRDLFAGELYERFYSLPTKTWEQTDEQKKEFLAVAESLLELYNDSTDELAAVHPEKEMKFWKQALLNLVTFARDTLSPSSNNLGQVHNVRDKAMAETLSFLANEYFPDEKIIVWAASFHNIRHADQIKWLNPAMETKSFVSMGTYVWEEFGDDIYSIAFVYNDGLSRFYSGRHETKLEPAQHGSLEWYMNKLGAERYFLDITDLPQDHWLRNGDVTVRCTDDLMGVADWPRLFDAFIFVRTIVPTTTRDDIKLQ